MLHESLPCQCPETPHKVAGLRLLTGYRSTDIIEALGAQPPYVPAGMIDDPGYIPGTVKGGGRRASAPHIGIPQILLRLRDHGGKGFIRQGFRWNIIEGWLFQGRGVRIYSRLKQVWPIP